MSPLNNIFFSNPGFILCKNLSWSLQILKCRACLGFGAFFRLLRPTTSCVKCGHQHPIKVCTNTPEQPPKCCNSGGEHTANCSMCLAFSSDMARLSQSFKQTVSTQSPSTSFASHTSISPQPVYYYQSQTLLEVSAGNLFQRHNQNQNLPQKKLVKIFTDTISNIANSFDLKIAQAGTECHASNYPKCLRLICII